MTSSKLDSDFRPVFRFAPSPNGYLHLGHAYSALLNHELARELNGRFLLRYEDIDTDRCRQDYVTAAGEELAWLGLRWEQPERRQSEHFIDYARALKTLTEQGLIYPCFCSRTEIMSAVASKPGWPKDPDGTPLYPGTCKDLSQAERKRRRSHGLPAALRIDMSKAIASLEQPITWLDYGQKNQWMVAAPQLWGDAILARKDIQTSYHIAVVVDDALQGVTMVVRGEDLFMATSLHRLLQHLLHLPEPDYYHHPLLRDASGQKLSKSLRSKSLRSLREEGLSPERARAMLMPNLAATMAPVVSTSMALAPKAT
jgi:glutamyl-Q tRNA(Asp) synthetase